MNLESKSLVAFVLNYELRAFGMNYELRDTKQKELSTKAYNGVPRYIFLILRVKFECCFRGNIGSRE